MATVIGIIKQSTPSLISTKADNPLKQWVQKDSLSYWFVGSSRVKASVNPVILRKCFHNEAIYTLGINGSTFLNTCAVVHYLVQNQPPKVIFIEISPILAEISYDTYRFAKLTQLDVLQVTNSLLVHRPASERLRLTAGMLSDEIFYAVSISEDIKRVWAENVDRNNKSDVIAGYHSLTGNNFRLTSSFLTYAEIEKYSMAEVNSGIYEEIIQNLITLAIANGSKLIFFLPQTYKSDHEKKIVIPLYQRLPDSMKIAYSEAFTQRVTKAEFLFDATHLNTRGAEMYTQALCPILEPHFSHSLTMLTGAAGNGKSK